jgi:hypothetical protein
METIFSNNILDISNKGLTELPYIEPHIKFVKCDGNSIEKIDYLPENVIYLDCGFNQLKNLDFLRNSKVERLTIQGNKFIEVKEIPNSLVYLDCRYCNLQKLPKLTNLTFLNCKGNKLKNLNLNNVIETLDASKNTIKRINQIPDSLKYLNLSHNKLTTLPPLHEGIMQLTLGYNQFKLESLPILPSIFCVHSFARMILEGVKGVGKTTYVKYLNGDSFRICDDITYEEYESFDKRNCNVPSNLMCVDLVNAEDYNLIQYLGKNTDNIIIESNRILYCYKRSELIKHIGSFSDNCINYINQIQSMESGEIMYKLYMREFINKQGLDLLMNRRYTVFKLIKNEEKIIQHNDNFESPYNVSGMTLQDYLTSQVNQ